jgi:hypothetical protein
VAATLQLERRIIRHVTFHPKPRSANRFRRIRTNYSPAPQMLRPNGDLIGVAAGFCRHVTPMPPTSRGNLHDANTAD